MTKQFLHIHRNVSEICAALENATQKAGRTPREVELEIAIKTRSAAESLQAGLALEALQRPALLAHNRVQEAQVTTPILRTSSLKSFKSVLIGSLQRNKINHALRCFNEFEALDSVALASSISQRLAPGDVFPVMLQVNTCGEASKSGFLPEGAVEAAAEIAELPGLKVVGFMTIGAHTEHVPTIARSFAYLRQIRDDAVKIAGLEEARQLSMGMSGDFEIAIAEGSTRVRIGTAVFGARR